MSDPAAQVAEVKEYGRTGLAQLVRLAREDINTFCELVLRDEEDGSMVRQAPLHEHWHDLVDKHKRLVIWSHTEAGKSSQLAVGRSLFSLGKNPNARIVIIGNTREQASKMLRTIAKYIEESAELKLVFPDLRKSDSQPWTANAIYIDRDTPAKDPSVQAFGVHGAIMGARIDMLVMDDVLDYENCQTPAGRADLWNWYHSSVASRLTREANVICVGTAWHPDDLLHRFERHEAWEARRFPVLDANGVPTWPERWPLERIEEQRIERGPLEFARTMMCQAIDDSTSRFKREYIDKALRAGEGWPIVNVLTDDIIDDDLAAYDAEWRLGNADIGVYTGIDLAVQKRDAADETAMVSVMVMPNGDRRLLNVRAGRWSGPEIIDKIIECHRCYGGTFIVEGNAAQDYIRQFVRESTDIDIRSFVTGRNKHNPQFGVESLASEMANGKWIIPNEGGAMEPEIQQLVTEMIYYAPDAHTGDRLMALWFAREGIRHQTSGGNNVGVRIF